MLVPQDYNLVLLSRKYATKTPAKATGIAPISKYLFLKNKEFLVKSVLNRRKQFTNLEVAVLPSQVTALFLIKAVNY